MLYYAHKGTKRVMKGSELMETVAEKLKKARGDIPRKTVCEAVGISLSAIMMYENGARIPRDSIKKKLADFYHMSVEELFY